MDERLLGLIHENEQDAAAGARWLDETAVSDVMLVWDRLQIEHEDPIDEVITRLAQLKLAELIEAKYRNEQTGK